MKQFQKGEVMVVVMVVMLAIVLFSRGHMGMMGMMHGDDHADKSGSTQQKSKVATTSPTPTESPELQH